MCEAFLRIRPHFGLWLKTFNVKPKVVVGQPVECGGAMVGKIPNVTWIEGSYVGTCSDHTSNGPISVLRYHPWISNADTTQYLKDL